MPTSQLLVVICGGHITLTHPGVVVELSLRLSNNLKFVVDSDPWAKLEPDSDLVRR
jgi:hypothetical protein